MTHVRQVPCTLYTGICPIISYLSHVSYFLMSIVKLPATDALRPRQLLAHSYVAESLVTAVWVPPGNYTLDRVKIFIHVAHSSTVQLVFRLHLVVFRWQHRWDDLIRVTL